MKRYYFLIGLYIVSQSTMNAQPLLTPEEAVSIALKNNYDILVAQNDANIARINNTPGNAGMLPAVSLSGSDNYSKNNINQKLASGTIIKSPHAESNSLDAAAELNWTLFDGGKMFVTKNKLAQLEVLGQLQFKEQVMQTVYDVNVGYYDVVRQMQQLASISEGIFYNKERVKIAQTTFDAGLSPKTNLLQAKIDLNVNLEDSVNQQALIIAAKRTLNQLLARNMDEAFAVVDTIPLTYHPDINQIEQKLLTSNLTILASEKQTDVALLSLHEYNALRLPSLSVSAGYEWIQTDNTAGNILRNHSYGPSLGGSISIPLYQGGNTVRQIKTARLQLQSSRQLLENVKLQANQDLQNAVTQFENQRKLLLAEKDNIALAKENMEISLARLKMGQTTTLEARQAQQSFVEAHTRLTNFQYNMKVAETKLKQLLAEL